MFNGSLVQSDVKIARMIGEYWRCDIQKGRAGYFNGNSKDYLERMSWPAVGTFTEASEAFLKGIRNISEYLAKPDPLVRIALPQIGRSLRRSCLTVGQRRRIARRLALAERRLMWGACVDRGKEVATSNEHKLKQTQALCTSLFAFQQSFTYVGSFHRRMDTVR